jgi:hypothetical protein
MPGAEWLELLCRHIPDQYEHLVRYVGWYSNRASESRLGAADSKVYEADPLECPKCKGPMRVIALIHDPGVVRRILEHLRRWMPKPAERTPPPREVQGWPPCPSRPTVALRRAGFCDLT